MVLTMKYSFGNNAGQAFAFAFKSITQEGKRAKLFKEGGQWFVTVGKA